MEAHGHERRWRYFTLASYLTVIANEKLHDQDGPCSSMTSPALANLHLSSRMIFIATLDSYAFSKFGKTEDGGEEAATKKRGRPPKYPLESQHSGTGAILKSVAPLPESGHGQ
jgi:AT hook motif